MPTKAGTARAGRAPRMRRLLRPVISVPPRAMGASGIYPGMDHFRRLFPAIIQHQAMTGARVHAQAGAEACGDRLVLPARMERGVVLPARQAQNRTDHVVVCDSNTVMEA